MAKLINHNARFVINFLTLYVLLDAWILDGLYQDAIFRETADNQRQTLFDSDSTNI